MVYINTLSTGSSFEELKKICENWGCKVHIGNESSVCCNTGDITVKSDEDHVMATILAHEMGHILISFEKNSEKIFPHLRLFRKDGKYRLKSNKFCRFMYLEEKEAWNKAREILNSTFPKLISLSYFLEDKCIQSYKQALQRTIK